MKTNSTNNLPIQIIIEDEYLVLIKWVDEESYFPDNFESKINGSTPFKLKNTFKISRDKIFKIDYLVLFNSEIIKDQPDHKDYTKRYHFIIGKLVDGYYKLDNEVFNLKNNFYFKKGINISIDHFISNVSISIFTQIDSLIEHDVYIEEELVEGSSNYIIPLQELNELIKNFPNSTEVKKYRLMKVAELLSDFINQKKEASDSFFDYTEKKKTLIKTNPTLETIYSYEVEKYRAIYKRLEDMLNNESQYDEIHWQNEIIKILLILYPKYVDSKNGAYIINNETGRKKVFDIALVDFNGNIDILEIKKSYKIPLLAKTLYRGNYFLSRELSGTVVQLENYLYHLNKLDLRQIEKLKEKWPSILENDIDVINPKGIIIAGRTNTFDREMKRDFEVIKKMYANVIDIISYDELLKRINAILLKFESLSSEDNLE